MPSEHLVGERERQRLTFAGAKACRPTLASDVAVIELAGLSVAWGPCGALRITRTTMTVLEHLDGAAFLGELVEDVAAALDSDIVSVWSSVADDLEALEQAGALVGLTSERDGASFASTAMIRPVDSHSPEGTERLPQQLLAPGALRIDALLLAGPKGGVLIPHPAVDDRAELERAANRHGCHLLTGPCLIDRREAAALVNTASGNATRDVDSVQLLAALSLPSADGSTGEADTWVEMLPPSRTPDRRRMTAMLRRMAALGQQVPVLTLRGPTITSEQVVDAALEHVGSRDATGTDATAPDVDVEDVTSRIDAAGYAVVGGVIEQDLLQRVRDRVMDLESQVGLLGKSLGTGTRTIRVPNLLARDPVFAEAALHPTVLRIVDRLLDSQCLLSSIQSITLEPGEAAQPLHADQQAVKLQRPQPLLLCNVMWALDDFTEDNGATRLVPGSHLSGRLPEPDEGATSIAAEMTAGSVLVYHGELWHGGGENRTEHQRHGLSVTYCAGWTRPIENQLLGIPLDTVRSFPERLRVLCGFGVYNGLIGHIEFERPAARLLGPPPPGSEPGPQWDPPVGPVEAAARQRSGL